MPALISTFRHHYGASPLHLLAFISSIAVTGAALAGWLAEPEISIRYILIWFVGAIVAHDIILLPLYSALDRAALAAWGRRELPAAGALSGAEAVPLLEPAEPVLGLGAEAASVAGAEEAPVPRTDRGAAEAMPLPRAEGAAEAIRVPRAEAGAKREPVLGAEAGAEPEPAGTEPSPAAEADAEPTPEAEADAEPTPMRSPGWVYVRIPLLLSGLVGLVFGAEILREGNATFRVASGHTQDVYLSRYLIVVAALFMLSGLAYVRSSARASSRIP